MNGAERLLECFRADRLVGPSSEETNFVDLVRSLLRLAGAKGIPTGPGVEKLSQLIGPAEHYVFILVDGMGVDLLEKLPPDGFLRSHLAARLQAVFPSTTASALTTLATAEWPGAHGVPGWWLYLEKFNLSAISLRFAERFSERPLEELGVAVGDVFCVPSVWPRARHAPLSVLAAHIAETTFSRYARGQTAGAGYRDVPEALRVICDRVARAAGPTVTYLYLPQLDALCHRKGTADEAVAPLLAGLEEQLGGLADELAGQAVTFLVSPFFAIGAAPARQVWLVAAGGFALFRLFDITKPWPIRKLETLPKGWGILADDLLAGVYAWIVLQICMRLFCD